MINETDAYAAYLAAIEAERRACKALLIADNVQPFDQAAFDDAMASMSAAQLDVTAARRAWYEAAGNEYKTAEAIP